MKEHMKRGNAIVFVGMVSPCLIIRHFALVASEGRKLAEADGVDYYFASAFRPGERRVSVQRSWDVVRQAFAPEKVIEGPDFLSVVGKIELLFERYEKVVVHFQGGWTQLKVLIPLRKRFGNRIVLIAVTQYFRNDTWLRIPMSMIQYFLYSRYVDLVNFQSPFSARKFWGSRKLFARGKGVVIPMGCEEHPDIPDAIPDSLSGGDCGRALLDARLFKFVYLAAFREGKKHAWLVHAMAPELRRHQDVRVLLCGTGPEAVVNDVRAAIAEESVSGQVFLPGQIPHGDLPWLLAHCNAAVIPSCSETFGHAFVEPMMAGLPILGTRVGAGEYVIREYETGYTFELTSPKSLQSGFRKMVERRADTKRMGDTARKMAKLLFSFEEVARTWHSVYLDFLEADVEAQENLV